MDGVHGRGRSWRHLRHGELGTLIGHGRRQRAQQHDHTGMKHGTATRRQAREEMVTTRGTHQERTKATEQHHTSESTTWPATEGSVRRPPVQEGGGLSRGGAAGAVAGGRAAARARGAGAGVEEPGAGRRRKKEAMGESRGAARAAPGEERGSGRRSSGGARPWRGARVRGRDRRRRSRPGRSSSEEVRGRRSGRRLSLRREVAAGSEVEAQQLVGGGRR